MLSATSANPSPKELQPQPTNNRMKNKEIIIIVGLPRSGASLIAQMLENIGIRLPGIWPHFEPSKMASSPDPAFIDACEGGAIKLLNPDQVELPSGYAYRFVFITRSKRQMAMSTAKFMIAMNMVKKGRSLSEEGLAKMAESLSEREKVGLFKIRSHGCPIHRLRFEDLIDRPEPTIEAIAEFLGLDDPTSKARMEAVIRPRKHGSLNYEGLLDVEMMQEREKIEGKAPDYDPLLCTCNFPGVVAPCDYCTNGNFCLQDEKIDVVSERELREDAEEEHWEGMQEEIALGQRDADGTPND